MGWSIGYDSTWNRDIGYGVPAYCDHTTCGKEIDRGLSYVCGGEPYGGDYGCGLFFCGSHLVYHKPRGAADSVQLCPRCSKRLPPYKHPSREHPKWLHHKLTEDSWAAWRNENLREVERMRAELAKHPAPLVRAAE
jgi:hypothetical protein